jgi:hypothetical protein
VAGGAGGVEARARREINKLLELPVSGTPWLSDLTPARNDPTPNKPTAWSVCAKGLSPATTNRTPSYGRSILRAADLYGQSDARLTSKPRSENDLGARAQIGPYKSF